MSKRDLYKPAPSQTPPQVGRQSLIQGRLVNTDPRQLISNTSPSVPKPTAQTDRPLTRQARRSLDYHPAISARKSDQHPPHYQMSPIIVMSPAKVKPSSSLSLSEPEEEPKTLQAQETNKPTFNQPCVLTVDASQRHSSFKDNEVPIKTSYVKSPVKVVCHSPLRKTPRTLTDTTSTHYAHAGKIQVPVEAVPAVNVLQGSVSKIDESHSSSSPPVSEDESVGMIAGSPVDPRSKGVETRVVREKNNPRMYVSFLDQDESVTSSDMPEASDQFEIRIGQPKFDDTAISSIATDSILGSIGEEGIKKKKKARVVQSKYMSSAMSRKGQKSSTAKRAYVGPKIKVNPKTKKAETKLDASKPLLKEHEKAFENGRKKQGHKVPQFTSTPALAVHRNMSNTIDSIPVTTPAPNRSAPCEDNPLLKPSFFVSNKDQSQKKKSNLKDVSHSKDVKKESSAPNRQIKQQTTGDVSQVQLDLQYARLCQWRFLRSKARHTFEKQEKDVQEQMYSMWQLDDQLRTKNHELKMQLATKQKREEIDRQLELQLPLLKNLDEIYSRLFPYYDELYEGIDTTRHHVTVKDILLPENEGDLLAALDSCENTLGEITTLFQDNQPKVLSFSNDMQVLADTVLEERKQHNGCTELLAAASTLTTQEKSLQADLLQRKEC